MDIINMCLEYFKNIDINFDVFIIADTQNKTIKSCNYICHADESEFFSRKEFSEIAEENDVKLFEDSAHALGAKYDGKK